MNDFSDAFATALDLMLSFDRAFLEIVALSLKVSVTAVFFAALLGLPLGALLALKKFPGRGIAVVFLNALMGLPPVVVGLAIYLMLSRAGPFGVFGLLYTPAAMIVAQAVLVLPIIAAIARQTIADLHAEYADQLTSLGAHEGQMILTLLAEGRSSLLTALLAGFGRAIAEVGAVMIVGGNIDHYTRTMTTAIALETSKGNLSLAMALGMLLILLTIAVNAAAFGVRRRFSLLGGAS
jgi:tungstate transport system permease protein